MFDVITIGSAVRDVFARTSDLKAVQDTKFSTGTGACFPLGSKLNLDDVEFSVGGGGINTAVTFVNQGYKAGTVAVVGADPEGDHILDKAAKYGIHCEFISKDKDHGTSFSFILSLPNGSRTVFRYKGASFHLREKDMPWKQFKAKWIYVNHLAGDSHKVLPRIFQEAKKKNIRIAWNPGSTQLAKKSDLKKLMSAADVFIVNQEEAAEITGVPYQKKKDIFKRMDALVQGKVIMTKGKEGVDVSDGQTLWTAGVLPMKKVVDRTGAGDAFGAGFISALLKKQNDVEYAMQVASANATGVLTEWGANHGLLKKKDSPTKFGKLKIKKIAL